MQIAKQFGEYFNYSIYQLNHKMGLAGTPNGELEQEILTPPIYDVIYPFVNGYAIVKKGTSYGVLDKFGNVTIPVVMPYIRHNWREGYFYVSSNLIGGWNYIVDGNNRKVLVKSEIEEAKSIIESYFGQKPNYASYAVCKQIIFATLDSGDFIFNNELKTIIFRGNGRTKVINGDKIIVEDKSKEKYGIINIKGDVLVPFVYDDLFYCADEETFAENNLIEAKLNGKSGYIDFTGSVRIPFDYEYCGTFEKGTAWVSNEEGKAGLIDYKGQLLEPLIHDNIIHLKNGNIVFIDNNDLYHIEQYFVYGKPFNYVKNNSHASHFYFDVLHNPDFVGVETYDRKRGITHLDGTIIIPAEYDDILFWQYIRNDSIIVQKGNSLGIINLENRVLVDFIYEQIDIVKIVCDKVTKYYYMVQKNGKYGLLNNKFQETIPMIYNNLSYSEMYNAFFVTINKENALVNSNNEILIPFTKEYLRD